MLGEMLLKVGALTRAQLEQVLNAQAIYGGKLGTNLVEMGFLGEDELARVLNEKLGVPCVDVTKLNDLSGELLALIPLEMVQRYHVLPVSLQGKKLTLAMADPSDFKAIDEIGFYTGYVIVPRVCSELRLNMALERYFGIKRKVRYIPVAGGFRSRFTHTAAAEDDAGEGSDVAGFPFVQPRQSKAKHVTVSALADLLAAASGEVEVVAALMSYLAGEFDRGAFLSVRRNMAVGVKAVGAGEAVDGFAGFTIPLEDAQLLKKVVEERRLYLGELAAEGDEGRLVKAMGGDAPSPALLVPLSVEGQVAALMCANDLKGRLSGGVFELQRVAAMAELTFEMICIRKRIKSC